MANEILSTFKTAVEPTITLTSLANGAGRISALIDNSTTRATRGLLAVKVNTGTSPTANTSVRYYLIRQSNGATNVKGGGGNLGDVDAAVAAEPTNAVLVGDIVVSSTSNASYSELFMIYDPGPKFSFVAWNGTGVALSGSAASPAIQWVPILDEVQ